MAKTDITPKAPVAPAAAPVQDTKIEKIKDIVKDTAEEIKTAAKAVKKPRVKKEAAEKPAVKKATVEQEVFIEYNQKQATAESLIERSKESWIADGGKAADIKSIRVYVNTNEGMVYYVINDSAGSFAF